MSRWLRWAQWTEFERSTAIAGAVLGVLGLALFPLGIAVIA